MDQLFIPPPWLSGALHLPCLPSIVPPNQNSWIHPSAYPPSENPSYGHAASSTLGVQRSKPYRIEAIARTDQSMSEGSSLSPSDCTSSMVSGPQVAPADSRAVCASRHCLLMAMSSGVLSSYVSWLMSSDVHSTTAVMTLVSRRLTAWCSTVSPRLPSCVRVHQSISLFATKDD